jgi:hypothetical protein
MRLALIRIVGQTHVPNHGSSLKKIAKARIVVAQMKLASRSAKMPWLKLEAGCRPMELGAGHPFEPDGFCAMVV